MPSGTVCAAMGNAAQTHQSTNNTTICFILLYKQVLDCSQRDKSRPSERGCLLIFVLPTRWGVSDSLAVIDAQSRIDRRRHVIHHWLLFIFPTVADHFSADFVRFADDPPRLDAAAQEHVA